MGYELHIIRRDDYVNDEEESSITIEEWLRYVANDDELTLTNGYQMNIPSVDTSWKESPGFCSWIIHTGISVSEPVWFDFWKGVISAKYPSDETIKKMLLIAKALNAKVVGDDNEFYDDTYFANKKIPDNISQSSSQIFSEKKPWWKFW